LCEKTGSPSFATFWGRVTKQIAKGFKGTSQKVSKELAKGFKGNLQKVSKEICKRFQRKFAKG
jgi:hypothetical protein